MNESKTMNRFISGLLPYAVLGVALAAPLAPRAEPFSVGPKYIAPNPAPAALLNAAPEAVSTAAAPGAAWWGVFEDPVLDDLVKRSVEGNLDLKQAEARLRQSRALFKDARLGGQGHGRGVGVDQRRGLGIARDILRADRERIERQGRG